MAWLIAIEHVLVPGHRHVGASLSKNGNPFENVSRADADTIRLWTWAKLITEN